MWGKFSALLHQAAEVTSQVLAPQLSRPEEFQGHWRAITECLASDSDDQTLSVESAGISQHLNKMADILCEEEEERDPRDPGSMGPCMEFLLRHKILNVLYTTGESNYPSGMRREVLVFFTILIGRLERPILPQVPVHQPTQKLVGLCGESNFSLVATDEVQFLRTLTLKLQHDPRLANLFLEEGDPDGSKRFMIGEALLRLVHNQDSLVVIKSYECLLTCSSLEHSVVSQALARSHLPMLLASHLQYHLQLIPSSCHPSAILNCNAGWGVDYAGKGPGSHLSPTTHLTWHMEAYLSWLDYCEQIVTQAAQPLADAVCSSLQELLLTAALLPRLTSSHEEKVVQSTAVLVKSLQALSTRRLLEEFVNFVLCEEGDEGQKGGVSLRDRLIQRTDHVSDEVCQVTLQLFDVLLHTPLPSITHSLILRYLGSDEDGLTVPTEELRKERVKLEETISCYLCLVPDHLSSCKSVSDDLGLEQYLVEAHLQVAACRAMTLLWHSSEWRNYSTTTCQQTSSPDRQVESGGGGKTENEETGEGKEVLKDSVGVKDASESTRTGKESLAQPETPSSDNIQSFIKRDTECPLPGQNAVSPRTTGPNLSGCMQCDTRREGPLLAALLTKLERLLDQPYEVNLLLTSIFARLAAIPHPAVEQWLFSPTTCESHSARNVFSILRKIASDLQTHADHTPGLLVNMVEARRRLAGVETSDLLSMPHNDLLEGAIILEEFVKEIAAVLFARKTTALLTLPHL